MTNYCISYGNSDDNFIQVSLKIDKLIGNYSYFQLPAWRPGRYELGNFAQNMFKLNVINEKGETLECKKISKDKWLVNNTNAQEITLTYTYACVIKNAGGTFKSPKQLIVTPVNCLIYAEHLIKEACTIEIQTPENFKQISSVKNNTCSNYYELAASPFVCGTEIKQECYTLKGINFHVVFEGKVNPNWKKIIHDFSLFTLEQLELFKTFPSTDYYFLNLIFEEQHYHGVEHLDSTLIALGPDSSFEEESFYNNLLGISSHELFV